MTDLDIIPVLTEIINSRPPKNTINDILRSLRKEITSNLDESAYDKIAPILHHIYLAHDMGIRASVINFCRKLEECSLTSITEKYMFDYLISQSLGQKNSSDMDDVSDYKLTAHINNTPTDQIKLTSSLKVQSHQNFHNARYIFNCYDSFSKQEIINPIESIDEEKLECFKYVETLNNKNICLSSSIIRSLVALYESDLDNYEGCKVYIIYLLAQASISLTAEQKYLMPSVLRVFSSYLFKDSANMMIPALLAYSIEKSLPIIYDDLFLMQFFWPLSNYSLFIDSKNSTFSHKDPIVNSYQNRIDQIEENFNEKREIAKQALIYFLRTWPGLFYFGIKNKAFEYMMICMSYQPKVIIDILRSLLNLKENTSSVTDGYSGFLLAELLKLGLIEKLNQKASIYSPNLATHSTVEIPSPSKSRDNNMQIPIYNSFIIHDQPRSTSSNLQKEKNEIIKCCEDFVNELLPFTSHCLDDENNKSNFPEVQHIKAPIERKTAPRVFQRNSFLNSDADLEFYNMSSLLNSNGDEYSSSIFSIPRSNSSFTLNIDESFSRMIDVAQVITHKSSLIAVNDVMSKKKDIDFMTIKWAEIQILLNVVLPYDQSEAEAASKLYSSMINFLSSSEFSNASPGKRIEMFEAYSSLFDLLLKGKLRDKFIEDNTKFKDLIERTINDIIKTKTVINFNHNNNKKIDARTDSFYKPPRSPSTLNRLSSANSIPQRSLSQDCFDMNSSKWFIFRLLMKIMSNKKGIAILKKWKIDNNIISIGQKINNSQLAEAILAEIPFYPDSSLAIPMFHGFLKSPNDQIPKYALSQLKVLRRKLPNFIQECFKPILIQHIKDLRPKAAPFLDSQPSTPTKSPSNKHSQNASNDKTISSLNTSLNFLGEIISTDEASLITVCEDIELIRIIFNNSHLIFSLLLSREETKKTWDSHVISANLTHSPEKNISLSECTSPGNDSDTSSPIMNKKGRHGRRLSRENIMEGFNCITFDEMVDAEIKRWMDIDNLSYLRAFHSAVDATFSGTLEEAILTEPAIFVINDCAQPPPHLFGQLSKLQFGLAKLIPYIEDLVNILVSLIDNPNYNVPRNYVPHRRKSKTKGMIKKEEEKSDVSQNEDNLNDSKSSFILRNSNRRSRHSNNTSPFSRKSSILSGSKRQSPSSHHSLTADESLCSILFALAQFGSVPSTIEFVEKLGIVDKMIQTAVASPSYVVKGALISCLSWFAPSNHLSSVLQRYKWQKFRFGNRSCIIPRKPRSLFRETAVKKLNVVTAANKESSSFPTMSSSSAEYSSFPSLQKSSISQSPSPSPSNIKKKPPIMQSNIPLRNPKTRQPSSSFDISALSNLGNENIDEATVNLFLSIVFDRKGLKELHEEQLQEDTSKSKNSGISPNRSSISASSSSFSSIPSTALYFQQKIGQSKINKNLKIWVNKLISSYAVENYARDLINCLFEDVPLMDLPENISNTNPPDQRLIITAQFNEFYKSPKGTYKDKHFKDVQPLVLSLNDLAKVKPPFPEASVSSKDFEKVASVKQSDFYELPQNKKDEIRNKLIGE